MPLELISSPEWAGILNVLKITGITGLSLLLVYVCIKILNNLLHNDDKRLQKIIEFENERWNQKFLQDATERARQYDLFKGLLENVSAHTGELSSISAKLDSHAHSFNEVNRNLGILHGRIDMALSQNHKNGMAVNHGN